MTDPLKRLAHVARVLARPVAVAMAAQVETPRDYAALGAALQRKPSSVRATLRALMAVGAVTVPEGAYLERALEAGLLRCALPGLLRGLADDIEKAVAG